jgi:hypothetical protein
MTGPFERQATTVILSAAFVCHVEQINSAASAFRCSLGISRFLFVIAQALTGQPA